MKNILILAALFAAAAISQASVPSPGGDCNGKSGKQSGCQTVEASTTQNCGGKQGRAQGKQKGKSCQKADKGSCQGKEAKQKGKKTGQSKGQGKQKGKGREQAKGQKGKGGNCGTQTFAELEKAVATKTKIEITPKVLAYRKALQTTLEEELYARDYYKAADAALDGPRRFGNLANAEQHHADAVANMITYLGGTPVMTYSTPIVLPADLAKADETCKEVELLVIKIYKDLIKDCPDPLILPALEHIQASNYRHLSAVGG